MALQNSGISGSKVEKAISRDGGVLLLVLVGLPGKHDMTYLLIRMICSSILGHHMYAQANTFILLMSGCISCNSSRTSCLLCRGTITQDALKMHPYRTLNSYFLAKYGWYSDPSTSSGQPVMINLRTHERIKSFPVQSFMLVALMQKDDVETDLQVRARAGQGARRGFCTGEIADTPDPSPRSRFTEPGRRRLDMRAGSVCILG